MFEFAYKEIVDDSPQAMRAQERRAMDHVIELLKDASSVGHEDLNNPENALPDQLRAGLISIGIWVNREIDRINSGAATDLTPLIEINEIIRDGLK